MKIQMLGTGSAFAKTYYNNNALVYADDFTLMIDCGITAPTALHKLGKSLNDIHAVLITHIHADHVGGLEELAFRMKFQHNRKPLLYVPSKVITPLWENTLKGGLTQDQWPSIDDFFDVVLLEEHVPVMITPQLKVEIIETPHIPNKPSYSLYINDRFFYSADMQFHPQLLHQLVEERGCRTIFHDCQFQSPGVVHACLKELLTLPDELQKLVWLMHYADDQEQFKGKTGYMRFVEQHKIYEV
ncbi:MBL fold metallo-hydrolase [Paenibacillus abyssi]|uniref:MBL fold hydrolase n=1 Tax=Paenibacillus abyssi TaxID=1340531 RepID=A0A917D3K8_9BACL|nr:MBL fold metallo-hydrolase [Paenibacillus abyssi]GGG09581.1 MBL fold hydrolase [Paenibacillus abyssi]